jgi:hypothetical protein
MVDMTASTGVTLGLFIVMPEGADIRRFVALFIFLKIFG